MANNNAVPRALAAGAAMAATLVFCGVELLFALNAWLAGASETQGAFAYLALGTLEPLPYPPSLVIQRNLMWLALAFLVGPDRCTNAGPPGMLGDLHDRPHCEG